MLPLAALVPPAPLLTQSPALGKTLMLNSTFLTHFPCISLYLFPQTCHCGDKNIYEAPPLPLPLPATPNSTSGWLFSNPPRQENKAPQTLFQHQKGHLINIRFTSSFSEREVGRRAP